MLKISNACIAYGEEELFSGFNLEVPGGEMVCIGGRSGKGKTSLLKAVMGFVPLREGEITVDEITLRKSTVDRIRRRIAWIPQELSLPSEWVSEMVRLPFDLKSNKKYPFSKEELFGCFAELELEEDLYGKRVAEISGGQRQRIMLATAAMLKKQLIIIDEPTSALDSGSMDRVLSFLRQRARDGAAILAVSHDKGFSAGCDKQIDL